MCGYGIFPHKYFISKTVCYKINEKMLYNLQKVHSSFVHNVLQNKLAGWQAYFLAIWGGGMCWVDWMIFGSWRKHCDYIAETCSDSPSPNI